MALVTKWAKVGSEAADGDAQRAQIALAQRRQAQSEAAQAFAQRRQVYMDRENAKRYQDQRADADAARARQERLDARQERLDAESVRRYDTERADRRADVDYARKRQERLDGAQEEQNAFRRMLEREQQDQRNVLFERSMAEYNALQKQKEEARQVQNTSLASLLTYGMQHGDRQENGNIFIPADAIEVFNKSIAGALGARSPNALQGVVMMTRDASGQPLPSMQVALMKQDGDVEVIPNAMMQALLTAFPGAGKALDDAFPDTSEMWKRNLGLTEQPTRQGATRLGSGGQSEAQAGQAWQRQAEQLKKDLAYAKQMREESASSGASREEREKTDRHYRITKRQHDSLLFDNTPMSYEEAKAAEEASERGGERDGENGEKKPVKDIDLSRFQWSNIRSL